jgi:HEAT repeat protein
MDAAHPLLFAADASYWLVDTSPIRSSTLILSAITTLGLLFGVIYWFGVVDRVFGVAGILIRGSIRIGYRVWERFLAWAPWPLFLTLQLGILGVGVAAADPIPAFAVVFALASLGMGVAACLAYMFIDIERYEVVRGHKALHDPLKGQRIATELVRFDHQVGIPLLASAAVGIVGGFALLNFGLFRFLGSAWYTPPATPVTYPDFVASALIHLWSVVDLLNLADSHRWARIGVARPANGLASFFLAVFKSFFTLILLQQIFASVRKGRLLSETISDFWSPHEPIHERARNALPQFGVNALGPLLLSLRSAEALTWEQRDQLPRVLATIGPSATQDLVYYLEDHNEHIRAVAVSTLGRLRSLVALPKLARLGEDPSELVRLSLAKALGEIGATGSKGILRPRRTRDRVSMLRLFRNGRTQVETELNPVAIVVQTLRLAIADTTAAIRAEAANSLGRLKASAAADAIPDLIVLLVDPDETVRGRAAEALGQIGACHPATVPALVGLLEDSSPAIRTAAARALGALGTTAAAAVPTLVLLLQDRDEGVRGSAADAVSRMGVLPESATVTLTEGLASDDNMVRARTAEALGAIGEAAVDSAPALVEALSDDNDRVRAKAVEALGKIGEAAAEVAVPRLVRALKDSDNWVSALAAEAIGEMGAAADEAVPALVRSLQHQNPQVRANSAEALGKLGPSARAAIQVLERAVEDDNVGVRLGAVRALGEIGFPTRDTVRVVRMALADADPLTRAAAIEAIGLWGEADEGSQADLLALLDDANDEVKARATRVLPKVAGASLAVVEGLIRRLAEDDSDWVRIEAARALGQLGSAAIPAGPVLLRAAQTGDVGLREEAMRALAISQPPESVEAFASGLRDAEPQIRKLASAGWMKVVAVPEEAIPALIEGLHDPEVQVRANVAFVLGRLDPLPEEAVPLLVEYVTHTDTGLRLNVALALQGVPGRVSGDALHTLLDDPNPRLRLIAARRVLTEDAEDQGAIVALADAMVNPTKDVRKAAADLAEAIGSAATAVLNIVQNKFDKVTDPNEKEYFAEAIEQLLRVSVRDNSGLNNGGTALSENRRVAAVASHGSVSVSSDLSFTDQPIP